MQLKLQLDQSQVAEKAAQDPNFTMAYISQLENQIELLQARLSREEAVRQGYQQHSTQSERHLHDFAEVAADIYWETDPYCRLTHLLSCRGAKAGHIVARYLGLHPDEIGFESAEPAWSIFKSALENRQPFRNFEIGLTLPSGLKLYFSINGQPIQDEQGGFLGYRGVCVDITERFRVEQKLRDREGAMAHAQKLAKIAHGVYDCRNQMVISGCEEISHLTGINQARLFGTSTYFLSAVHPDDIQVFSSKFMSAQAKQDFYQRQYRLVRQDGSVCHISEAGSIERDEVGKPARLIFAIQDITEQKQIENALIKARHAAEMASHAKSGFLAHMSHELRTPLNAIIGFSEVMRHETFGVIENDYYREYVTHIHNSGRHLLELINGVLDLSKIEAGKTELEEENCRLIILAEEAIETIKVRAEQKYLNVQMNVAPEISLFADPLKIKQVLINLLGNAVKFTPEEGLIAIDAKIDMVGNLNISVQDSGCGIAAVDIAKALEPFQQVNLMEGHARPEGTGLGLPLAKSLVELHQGQLKITSEQGKGTLISMILPMERVQLKARHLEMVE